MHRLYPAVPACRKAYTTKQNRGTVCYSSFMNDTTPSFDGLSPNLALSAAEEAFGLEADGSFFAYPSYVNRVYGFRAYARPSFMQANPGCAQDQQDFVVKFYRPGRWTEAAIREEHRFLSELAAEDIPVVCPLCDETGDSLPELVLETDSGIRSMSFALFPKRGGRSFDTESPEAYARLGSLIGRVHAVGARGSARGRFSIGPDSVRSYATELAASEAVHPDAHDAFFSIIDQAAHSVANAFQSVQPRSIRLHGDFHRGNVLDRQDEGLVAIDFDDLSVGPAVQDLWLLMPSRYAECPDAWNAALEGYERFMPFDRSELALVESLRILRMIHYLAWQTRQRNDAGFATHFPLWGSRSFWMQETEDLRTQLDTIVEGTSP